MKRGTAQVDYHADARCAFCLVVENYAIPLGLQYPSDHIHKIFHFVEAKHWAYYLRHIAYFNVPVGGEAKVEGITHSYGTDPKIGINKSYFTFATLVHESIHFFSHYSFRKAFSVNEYEGATEYLTRNLLDDYGQRRDVIGQGDIYANELAPFLSIMAGEQDIQLLRKAYFEGNKELISLLKKRLKPVPDMGSKT